MARQGEAATADQAANDRAAWEVEGGEGVMSSGFGIVVGRSKAMQEVFAVLRRAAVTDVTVLIEGETGTGKEATAASIHEASARGQHPFVVIDCGAIAPNLLEAELFGHERGAFTGANARRLGAFEAAAGGTVLLDEIGELPLELQPKLLRVLEQRHIRRLGSPTYRPIAVRFLAATNRDLRTQVERGLFRADLFFRLAVLRLRLPPLRERPDDIPVLVRHLLHALGGSNRLRQALDYQRVAALQQAPWPGNVRQLRNYVERCILFDDWLPFSDEIRTRGPTPTQAWSAIAQPPHVPGSTAREGGDGPLDDPSVSFIEGRRRAVERWTGGYLRELMRRNGGDVARAAHDARIGRAYMYRLLSRHGILARSPEPPRARAAEKPRGNS